MSGAGDLKKDFKRMIKHSKRAFRNFFEGSGSHHDKYESDSDSRGPGPHGPRPGFFGYGPRPGYPPFSPFKHPITLLLYPKYVVGCCILITLLCCGVGLYGLIIIVLLMLLFICI